VVLKSAIQEKFESFKKQLLTISAEINNFSKHSEGSFLSIGNKLEQLYSNCSNLTSLSAQVSTSINENVLSKGIEELENEINQIDQFLTRVTCEIVEDERELIQIQSKMDLFSGEFSGFDRIIKQLRMLGISTKIESARLGMDEGGFLALAENVDRLSLIISDKISNIRKKKDFLIKVLNGTTSELKKLEKEQKDQSNLILQNINKSIVDFQNKQKATSAGISNINILSTNLVSSVSKIVSSIQFHDITRQQMEHTNEAFEELIYRIDNPENLDESETAERIHNVFELQTVQLNNSLYEFTTAVFNIVSNLTNIKSIITEIAAQAEKSLTGKKEEGYSAIEVIEKELMFVMSGLKKNIEIGNQVNESIKSIVEIISDLSKYVLEIEEIGDEIELIALNARVKAAHFGKDGSALGVLAEAIQRLSLEAKTHSSNTTEILRNLELNTNRLKTDFDTEKNNSAVKEINQSINKIELMLEMMKNAENEANTKIKTINKKVNDLNDETDDTINGFSISETAEQVVNSIINELRQSIKILEKKYEITGSREKSVHGLEHKYTMHSERKIHQRYTKGTLNVYNPSEILTANEAESHYEDNVELF
jgi:chromosome segregation ATPase